MFPVDYTLVDARIVLAEYELIDQSVRKNQSLASDVQFCGKSHLYEGQLVTSSCYKINFKKHEADTNSVVVKVHCHIDMVFETILGDIPDDKYLDQVSISRASWLRIREYVDSVALDMKLPMLKLPVKFPVKGSLNHAEIGQTWQSPTGKKYKVMRLPEGQLGHILMSPSLRGGINFDEGTSVLIDPDTPGWELQSQ